MDTWFGWPIAVNQIIAPTYSPFCHSVCLLLSLWLCLFSLLFSPSPSSFPSHFFPVTNQISRAPYGFCPLWVCMSGRNRGRVYLCVCLCVCVRLSCSYQMLFCFILLSAALSACHRQTHSPDLWVWETGWWRALVFLKGRICACVFVRLIAVRMMHIKKINPPGSERSAYTQRLK